MPKKIRELKSMLSKAGFVSRVITLAGNDGNDARPYQEKQVRDAVKEAEKRS